jgi:hypothetical protein
VKDRRGSKVGTIGERELGDDDLPAEDDSRRIWYFDRDGDAGEIHDHGGPDSESKVGGGCSVGGLLGGGCWRGRGQGRIEVTSKRSELSSFLKKFDADFAQKANSRSYIQGFPIIYLR